MGGLIRQAVTVPSGTTNVNILAGEIFEFLARPSTVRVILSQQIVLLSALAVDVNVGNVIVTQALTPNIAVAPGVVDQDRDRLPAAVGAAGDRVQIRVRETSSLAGADGILNFIVEITDIA